MPTPSELALAPQAGEMLLRHHAGGGWLFFTRPEGVLCARSIHEVMPVLAEIEAQVSGNGLWAAGYISYEASPAFDSVLAVRSGADAFPLLCFGLYNAPAVVRMSAIQNFGPACLPWTASVSEADYAAAFDRIKAYIRAGDIYQTNLTYRLRSVLQQCGWDCFRQLMHAQNAPYGAYLNLGDWTIASASPELFFELDGDRLESKPMKGTARRGLTPEHDREQRRALEKSEKDRAENVMIVDMVRNDLGRVAATGSVKVPALFEIEKYSTVWQMTSTVEARTCAGFADIMAATFPAASITGAPKTRAMQIIAALETTPRRVYTGAIGFYGPGRRAQFNVAIRTLLADAAGNAEYGSGGGIVWDSTATSEWEETKAKTRILFERRPPFDLLETLLWTPQEGFRLLDLHLRRMQESADYFDYKFNLDEARDLLGAVAKRLTPLPHKLRLLLTMTGQLTYEPAVLAAGPPRPARVELASTPVDSDDVFLYHKTTCRRVYETVRAASGDSDDVILYNGKGEATESTIANLLAVIDGVLCTPPVRCGLLNGTARRWLVDTGRVRERVILAEELKTVRHLYLVNSVRGLWPVCFRSHH